MINKFFSFICFFVIKRQATDFSVVTNGLSYVTKASVTFSQVGVLSKI